MKEDYFERLEVIDLLKGLAIFLVIFGHTIQFCSGENYLVKELFFFNPIFKAIYSFHMPLFTLISGFLFYFSKEKSFIKISIIKFKTLILPLICWQSLYWVVSSIIFKELSLRRYIGGLIYGLWFLQGIFYCSLILIITNKIFLNENKRKIVLFIIFLITLVTPDIFNIHLYKFIYPYYILGYYLNKNLEKFKILKKYFNWKINVLLVFINLFLLMKYDYSSYIYTSKYSILFNTNSMINQFEIDIYRFLIGFIGSLNFYGIVCYLNIKLKEKNIRKFLNNLGKNSLGIYIMVLE